MAQDDDKMDILDPDSQGDLADDQTSLNDDYLEDSVNDVEASWPDDNPEDAPAGGIQQLRDSVRDDMPGDSEQAAEREANSPNERHNQFDPKYFDTEENVDADFISPDGQTVDEALSSDESAGDPPADGQDFERRIG